ncbi:DUF3300 domain-containing protein [Geomonas sp. RF6]|uniref:DUF3300 domain-containing protein n=1 Tax=Geomonas sp. RF6 TaxID=2897342 RepID=UPI001E46BC2A|nr:DUF3300 domain-containing protein [Geomonas sp. RF6]UFS70250.1 DUF3300 domain-containing protein [Geomonas sp. RF6]
MKRKALWLRIATLLAAVLLALPLLALAQDSDNTPQKKLSKEELGQLLAPIALYPDDLVTQILMASTYPLEIVQADRWVKSHKQSAGEQLAKDLEKESWDPSVKSLVQFPTVLAAMSDKLDLTTKIGDAFLSQQQDVLETIQELRKKAQAAGNLKSTKEQVVVVEKETIIIKPADPQVIYVPSYSPTVVYGTWPYPAYPPAYYYPPPPPSYPAYHFAAGMAVGVAWGYAWGHSDWHGQEVTINHNQNVTLNRNIDRSKYENRQGGNSTWQHNPSHRKGVAYKDGATAKRYGQSPARSTAARADARGYGSGRGAGTGARQTPGGTGRVGEPGAARGAGTSSRAAGSTTRTAASSRGGRDSAFGGGYGSGTQERVASDRGRASRQSSFGSSGASRSGGGFGGGSRGGGGGFRGGGGGRRR